MSIPPSASVSPDLVRLSRGFETTAHTESMTRSELGVRSGVAVTLGLVPFVTSLIAMRVFKGMASLASRAAHQPVRVMCGLIGIPAGAAMIVSAKIFGLTQHLAWGKYAKNPAEDGPNQRLARYGLSDLPGQDLWAFSKAFLTPNSLTSGEWSLAQWSQLRV